jgi:5'-phosphate synthase pdxT subunit
MPKVEEIGVLNLQGGVQEHLDHLDRIGVPCRGVKKTNDFDSLAGLIIPGGETTCLQNLLRITGLDEVIAQKFREGIKLWGTCAGAILLAQEIVGESPHFGLIDITIERNAFGSQLDSFASEAHIPQFSSDPIPLIFIRAPKITRAGSGVNILLRIDDYIAAAESEEVLVTVFHPELTPNLSFHRYFAQKCGLSVADNSINPVTDASWTRKSWMRFARISGEK